MYRAIKALMQIHRHKFALVYRNPVIQNELGHYQIDNELGIDFM